jgi:cyanate permease
MYGWLWRKLPGPWPVKLVVSLILFSGFLAFCYYIFFPWLDANVFIENESNLQ